MVLPCVDSRIGKATRLKNNGTFRLISSNHLRSIRKSPNLALFRINAQPAKTVLGVFRFSQSDARSDTESIDLHQGSRGADIG
jgi:hypothetical protein